jgi:hypothetical protein
MGGAVVSSCAHIEAGMVPISVSLTDPNPDASDPNIDVFRDDNWFVADVQKTSKRRHCQERNKKKSKHSILHDILLGFGTLAVPILRRMRAWYSRSLYRIDQLLVLPVLFERTVFAARLSKRAQRCPLDGGRYTFSCIVWCYVVI